MKVFKSEYLNDYGNYSFGYTEYAIKENEEDITDIYLNGYLPYSANIKIKYPLFYLARSLRVKLSKFNDSSENRRINRKMEEIAPQIIRYNLSDFDIQNNEFIDFCMRYANERFSENVMSQQRFNNILNLGIATDIFEFINPQSNKPLGYVLAVINEEIFHYWFSFYNTELLNAVPIGKWLMWRMIKWSKENNLKYIFLGTGYGTKSLYKIRDFKGLEFFDGNFWNSDIKHLKTLCKADEEKKDRDQFKLLENPNEYLKTIISKTKN
ncbi:MAG TPA: GNAT family N-acetyltransferase [Bacteroidetes bacterium]|nr:GNAT family N-acetyltransferase [Bacteroidota bacterium]